MTKRRSKQVPARYVRFTPETQEIGRIAMKYGWCIGSISHGIVRFVRLEGLKVVEQTYGYVSDLRTGDLELVLQWMERERFQMLDQE